MSDGTLMKHVREIGALADTFGMAIAGGDSDFMGSGERITYVPEADLLRTLRRLKAAEAALREISTSGPGTSIWDARKSADAYFAAHGTEVQA